MNKEHKYKYKDEYKDNDNTTQLKVLLENNLKEATFG